MKYDKQKLFEGAAKRREDTMGKVLKSSKVQEALKIGRDSARREVQHTIKKKA